MKTVFVLVTLVACFLTLGGCGLDSVSKSVTLVGTSIGEVGAIVERTDTLGARLVRGAGNELTSEDMQRRLNTLVEGIILELGSSGGIVVGQLGDTLLIRADALRDVLTGDKLRRNINALLDDALGPKLREKLAALRDELTGQKTSSNLQLMVRSVIDELTSAESAQKISFLITSALDTNVKKSLASVVDTVGRTAQNRLGEAGEQLSFLQRNVTELLIAIGAIACAIIGFVWWQRRKYLRMTQLLTSQIHLIPDKGTYNELTKGISSRAVETGLEGALRDFLKSHGILGDETRKVVTGER